MTELISCHRA